MPIRKAPKATPPLTDSGVEAGLLLDYVKRRPTYEKIIDIAKAEIEYEIIHLKLRKKPWERIEVSARVKEFESALNRLKQYNRLDPLASVSTLDDMAALKIKVFPNYYLRKVQDIIERLYPGAKADHAPKRTKGMKDEEFYNNIERLKYIVNLDNKYKIRNKFEIQIVPFILDAFFDVEHDIIYKPGPDIPKLIPSLMKESTSAVIDNLKSWPADFLKHLKEKDSLL